MGTYTVSASSGPLPTLLQLPFDAQFPSFLFLKFCLEMSGEISDDENEEFFDASDGTTNDIQKAWDELMVNINVYTVCNMTPCINYTRCHITYHPFDPESIKGSVGI